MVKKLLLVISLTVNFCVAQNVAVGDTALETYLETHDASGNSVVMGHATSIGNGSTDNLVELSKLEGITVLNIDNLGISNLDIIQAMINLQTLDCSDNSIQYLDLSDNTKLVSLDCSNNDLQVSLDVSNKDGQFSTFDASGNSDLTCIQVDAEDLAYMDTNFSAGKGSAVYSTNCSNVWVNDANFETYLETHDASGSVVAVGDASSMGNGIAADHMILKERVNTVTSLDISSQSIADLQGIEQFEALTTFDCSSNTSISEINLWNNTNLETIDFANNSLSYVGFHSCPDLTTINGSSNALINASTGSNPDLVTVDFSNNSLVNYNISFTQNTLLQTIDISNNTGLSILDLSAQTVLVDLDVSGTSFSSLTEPVYNSGTLYLGTNTGFTTLNFASCSFTSLDLSTMTALVNLDVSSNSLTELNIKNGNNANFLTFSAVSNASLSCVEVDSKTFMDTSWAAAIDGSTQYSEDCDDVAGVAYSYLDNLKISVVNRKVVVNYENLEIKIYNFLGVEVKNENLNGVYIVKITDENNKSVVNKIHI